MKPINKLLYIHIPKTAGVYFAEYITTNLPYRRILSNKRDEAAVWTDYTLDELCGFLDEEQALLHTHTLSYGWHDLAYIIPWASQAQIVATIRRFKKHGWFTCAFVRHPGELLCSFYHYVLDFQQRGMPNVVAAHIPVVERALDEFVADHCDKLLLPSYWRELDFVAEASDQVFTDFFKRYFDHDFQPGTSPSHASGSLGYHHYCAAGVIAQATQRKVEQSINMQIYQQITHSTQRSAL